MLLSICRNLGVQARSKVGLAAAVNTIPKRCHSTDVDDNLSFFQCVEKFFDRAASILEPTLVAEMKGLGFRTLSQEAREMRVQGLLSIIKPCNRVLSVTFPVQRDSGHFEIIRGYRAQHSDHLTPCKGGKISLYCCHKVTRKRFSLEQVVCGVCPRETP